MAETTNTIADVQYLNIVRRIVDEGEWKDNRTGVKTKSIAGAMFEHDMSKGFPLLTTKKMPFKNVASELEFFIKGITDKKWLQDRNNHIWDEWANPRRRSTTATPKRRRRRCLRSVIWVRCTDCSGGTSSANT